MQLLLKNLIRENIENRISLMKINAILEKVLPELSTTEATRLSELHAELSIMVEEINQLPYTTFNMDYWKIKVGQTYYKANQLKTHILTISEDKKEIVGPLINALDEIFTR